MKSTRKPVRPADASTVASPTEQASIGAAAPGSQRPVLPSQIPQYFLPAGQPRTPLVYRPMLLGVSQIRFSDLKRKVDVTKDSYFLAPLTNDPMPVNWETAKRVELNMSELANAPLDPAKYSDLPAAASMPKNYPTWQKDFINWLMRSQRIDLLRSPSLDQYSKVGESESDFRIRMQLAARELSDQNMEKLRGKYAPKYAALDERIRKAQMAVDKEQDQAKRQKYQSAVSLGSTLLSAVVGRKVSSSGSRTARDYGRVQKEKQDLEFAGENLDALRQQKRKLEVDFQTEVKLMGEKTNPLTERLETISIMTNKANISVKLVALVWSPTI